MYFHCALLSKGRYWYSYNKGQFTTTTNYLKHEQKLNYTILSYSIQYIKKSSIPVFCLLYSYICKLNKAFPLLWKRKGRKEVVDGRMDGWMDAEMNEGTKERMNNWMRMNWSWEDSANEGLKQRKLIIKKIKQYFFLLLHSPHFLLIKL